jgi:hypothetical protein
MLQLNATLMAVPRKGQELAQLIYDSLPISGLTLEHLRLGNYACLLVVRHVAPPRLPPRPTPLVCSDEAELRAFIEAKALMSGVLGRYASMWVLASPAKSTTTSPTKRRKTEGMDVLKRLASKNKMLQDENATLQEESTSLQEENASLLVL